MTSISSRNIDVASLHTAFMSEGFEAVDSPQYCNPRTHTAYQKYEGVNIYCWNVPNAPVDASAHDDQREALHYEVAEALRFLWEVTGNTHCGLDSSLFSEVRS